jgi:hypothetical protein
MYVYICMYVRMYVDTYVLRGAQEISHLMPPQSAKDLSRYLYVCDCSVVGQHLHVQSCEEQESVIYALRCAFFQGRKSIATVIETLCKRTKEPIINKQCCRVSWHSHAREQKILCHFFTEGITKGYQYACMCYIVHVCVCVCMHCVQTHATLWDSDGAHDM